MCNREKARVPAWTDRILHKGRNLSQSSYSTAPLRISDHRPVYATFDCNVLVIDEGARDNLSQSLYRERRAALGYKTAASAKVSSLPDRKKEQPLIPSLSPISSAKEKFWNGNGNVKGNYVPHTADNTAAISRKPPISTKQAAGQDLAYRVPGKGSSTTASTISGQASGTSSKPSVPPARRSAAAAMARSNSSVRNTSSSTSPPIQPLRRSSTDVNVNLEHQQQQRQNGSEAVLRESESNQGFSRKPAPLVPQKPSTLSSLNSSSSFSTTTSTNNNNITSSTTSSSPSPSLFSSTRTPPSSDCKAASSSVKRTPSLPTKPVLLPGLAPSPGLPPAGRAAFLAMQKSNKGSNYTGNTGSAIGRSSASVSASASSVSSSSGGGGRSGGCGEKGAQVPQRKVAAVATTTTTTTTTGLMDEDVGNGLQEVDKWKALEPGAK